MWCKMWVQGVAHCIFELCPSFVKEHRRANSSKQQVFQLQWCKVGRQPPAGALLLRANAEGPTAAGGTPQRGRCFLCKQIGFFLKKEKRQQQMLKCIDLLETVKIWIQMQLSAIT